MVILVLYQSNSRMKMKTVGAVVFIRLLLMIGGIEPNPGPTVLRYLYLMIEIGSMLLRKLFDDTVKNDLVQYLQTNPYCAKQLTNINVLTKDQQKLLPPKEQNPDSTKFDITLLTCLLRNICGLKKPTEHVWTAPANNDNSVEAEITRLRQCRNEIQHMTTVHITKTELQDRWDRLCAILKSLNKYCNIPDLEKMIDEAETKPLDDQLQQQYGNLLEQWNKFDDIFEKEIEKLKIVQSKLKCGQSELKDEVFKLKDGESALADGQSKLKIEVSELKGGQSTLKDEVSELKGGQSTLKDEGSELKRNVSELKEDVSDLKDGQSTLKEEQSKLRDGQSKLLQTLQVNQSCSLDALKIKADLISYYKKQFRTLCVTPLHNEDDHMETLNLYAKPEMNHVPYHRAREDEGNYNISSYEQVFCKERIDFKNIFVTGDAGIGKTSFGQLMALLWCKAIDGEKIDNEEMRKDARFMTKFDLVFYLSLKDTSACYEDVVSMIVDRYFYTSSKDEFEETIKNIEHIFRSNDYECLIILDGLDEWRSDISGKGKLTLPRKVTSQRCTYLTLCRPHIIETVRLLEMDIDHQIQITGFDFVKYVRDVVNYINEVQDTSKDPVVFLKQIMICKMHDQLNVPVIASQLIFVWFEHELHNMSKALIYATTVDMMFKRATLKKNVSFPQITSTDAQLPESFSGLTYLQMYINTLEKVCLLSFLLLFDPNNKSPCLVVTKEQLMAKPYCISPSEVEFFCQLGIISKSKIIARFGLQEQKLSFIHQSYLEFLAALFVSFFDKDGLFNKPSLVSINDIFRYENFLILLAGISSESFKLFFDSIYLKRKDEIDFECRDVLYCTANMFWLHNQSKMYSIQRFALSMWKELSITNSQKCIKIVDIFYDNKNDDHLEELLVLNKNNVKYLAADQFCDNFTLIKGLEYLCVIGSSDCAIERFNDVMLHNQSSLHFIRIDYCSLSLKLPVRSLPHLTSICLYNVTFEHDVFQDLSDYISGNILLECIVLVRVEIVGSYMEMPINLSHHSKLHTLHMPQEVELKSINTSSLKSLHLSLLDDYVFKVYTTRDLLSILNNLINSKLEYLALYGGLDGLSVTSQPIILVIDVIRSLVHLRELKLWSITIPDNVSPLGLFTGTQSDRLIKIDLCYVRMTDVFFCGFIDEIINSQPRFEVSIHWCTLLNQTENFRDSMEKSMGYIVQFIESKQSLNVTSKNEFNGSILRIDFEKNNKTNLKKL